MSFTIELLPAREGDCLLLSYGEPDALHRVLIDGGRAATWENLKQRLAALPEHEREFELLVITHVDRDHIEGVLSMLGDPECPVTFKDIWFNGYGHLKAVDDEDFGAVQGERLTELLLGGMRWNVAFGKRSVRLPRELAPERVTLPGQLAITLLSPDTKRLVRMRSEWEKECAKAGLIPTDELPKPQPGEEAFGAIDVDALADRAFNEDSSAANGSSIALVAEYGGQRVLLGADAYPSVLLDALDRLFPDLDRIPFAAFKLAHHGSRANLSRELLERIDCTNYLVSTNGSYFKHPDREAIARVLKYGGAGPKTLYFNYRNQFTLPWDDAGLRKDYSYEPVYGSDGTLSVELG